MPFGPICFPKGICALRFERTEVGGLPTDYFFCREEDRSYSIRILCQGREEKLSRFTFGRLTAEAFYLLVKEEGVLPSSLDALWREFSAERS